MGLADFSIHRLEVGAVHFNGGFGKADRLTPGELILAGDFSALVAAEAELMARAQALGDAALARLAERPEGVPPRVAGIDAEGIDLSMRGAAARIDFSGSARDPADWRAMFSALASA